MATQISVNLADDILEILLSRWTRGKGPITSLTLARSVRLYDSSKRFTSTITKARSIGLEKYGLLIANTAWSKALQVEFPGKTGYTFSRAPEVFDDYAQMQLKLIQNKATSVRDAAMEALRELPLTPDMVSKFHITKDQAETIIRILKGTN